MNYIIASLRNQIQKIKCRIANLSNRVTYIEDNCCNGGGDGIQSIQEGDNISIDNTDPQNPIISALGGDTPTLAEVLTEGNVANMSINIPHLTLYAFSPNSTLYGGSGILSNFDIGTGVKEINFTGSGIIISDTKDNKGLIGNSYFGANYDDYTYVQKKYVDDNFLPLPTEGTSGQVLTTDGAGGYTWEDVEVQTYLQSITGYDAGETQTLKNVNGVLTWVTD